MSAHDTFPSRNVLVLVGPTASGKTTLSIELTIILDGEIISADSRQVYKYLDIGTAKPTREQMSQVKHHFVDELLPDQEFNAGQFGIRGRNVIENMFERKKLPIVTGGSGLYIHSLIDGFFEGPAANAEFREIMERQLQAGRVRQLIDELCRVDPVSAAKADPTKPRRIIRALEVYHMTGRPISEHQRERKPAINFTPVMFGLKWDREALYQRIEARCDEMIAQGLLDEIEGLERRGYTSSLNALNTVGYAEGFAYRRGEISYKEMIQLFKRNSRRFAKRQLTWFKRDARILWINMNESRNLQDVLKEISERFQRFST
ncbi:MAG: tRNA (adenosine(37)-N6)-dimethylallyltransferase MiaA [Ignavibacteria bacterium]|nr:tRNA (adenosine(37)-N6)-dimethylallyltransferase MiaA [Ignavibacteria bacterium]